MYDKKRWLLSILALLLVLVFQRGPAKAEVIGGIPAVSIQTLGPASVNGILGKKVTNPQGEDLGQVGGVLLANDRIVYVILHLTSPAGALRQIPIPSSMAELRIGEDLVLLRMEKRALMDAPRYLEEERLQFLELEYEQKIHSYYGEKPPENGMQSYILIHK